MAAVRRAQALRVAASRAFSASAPPPYDPAQFSFLEPQRIRRRGLGVVHDPWVSSLAPARRRLLRL